MERSPVGIEAKKLRYSLTTSKFSPKTRSGTENYDDSNIGNGMRDVLLMKCKQTIEELHLEVEAHKKARAASDETASRLERDSIDKDSTIRDLTHRNEKFVEETLELRSKVSALEQKLSESEQQLSYLEAQEHTYRQIQTKYQEICLENEEMAVKVNKLSAQLRNQEQFTKEWDNTLESINAKILSLEAERDDLQREKEKLLDDLKDIKTKNEESEKLLRALQGKCEFSERLASQLERENRAMEEVRIENKDLQATIEKLREKSEKLGREVTDALSNQERDFITQLEKMTRDLQKQHEEHLLQLKREHRREIDRFESTVEELRVDMSKLNTEKAYIKEDFKFLSEKLNSKEKELEDAGESFNVRWDQSQREKFEEIKQLKSLIDEQSSLINSYERMVEKDKRESGEEIRRFEFTNRQLKHEVQELTANNGFLANKLKECQEEFAKIQEEMKDTFLHEEAKNAQMRDRIDHLERQLLDRDAQIDAYKDEIKALKSELKLRRKDLEVLQAVKKEYSDEIFKVRSVLAQASSENEDLKDKQKELDITLKVKLEEMSEELRKERNRRTEAEYVCEDYKDQIRQLDAIFKQKETNYRNLLIKREGEIDHLRYQRKVDAVRDNRGSHDLSMRKAELIDRSSRSPKLDNSKISLSMTNQLRSANNSADRHPRQKEVSGTHKKSISRFEEPRGSVNERPQHTDFLDRFKNVVSKLETRLERLSTEMNQ